VLQSCPWTWEYWEPASLCLRGGGTTYFASRRAPDHLPASRGSLTGSGSRGPRRRWVDRWGTVFTVSVAWIFICGLKPRLNFTIIPISDYWCPLRSSAGWHAFLAVYFNYKYRCSHTYRKVQSWDCALQRLELKYWSDKSTTFLYWRCDDLLFHM
jgi:hypothetical protein